MMKALVLYVELGFERACKAGGCRGFEVSNCEMFANTVHLVIIRLGSRFKRWEETSGPQKGLRFSI